MKKVMMLFVAVMLVLTVSVTALAGPGWFTESPSGIPAPILVEFYNEDGECTAELKVTAYADRDTLDAETKAAFEKAYNDIVNAADLTALSDELKTLAEKQGIKADKLAISDLFDISYYDCEVHEDDDHGYFSITLKPEVLKNFVGLLHLKEGVWDLVDSAKVTDDGVHLTYRVEDLSPFAIIVNTDPVPPQTGVEGIEIILIVVMVLAALGLVVVALLSKKKKAE